MNGYNLNFVIPQGPTGPVGPANGLNAYGGKYNNTSSTISLGLGTQSQIPLPSSMPNLNTTYTQSNSITATQAGVYDCFCCYCYYSYFCCSCQWY